MRSAICCCCHCRTPSSVRRRRTSSTGTGPVECQTRARIGSGDTSTSAGMASSSARCEMAALTADRRAAATGSRRSHERCGGGISSTRRGGSSASASCWARSTACHQSEIRRPCRANSRIARRLCREVGWVRAAASIAASDITRLGGLSAASAARSRAAHSSLAIASDRESGSFATPDILRQGSALGRGVHSMR